MGAVISEQEAIRRWVAGERAYMRADVNGQVCSLWRDICKISARTVCGRLLVGVACDAMCHVYAGMADGMGWDGM